MAGPSTSHRGEEGRNSQNLRKGIIGTQKESTIINPPATGVDRLNIQDKQPQPQTQASLSNLPELGTGWTPDTARRGRKWFKSALPTYEPATKAITENTKSGLLPGSRSFTERHTYPSLHDRRTAGSNLDVVIVTEFLILPKDPTISFQRGFAERVSRLYNNEVPIEYPRMTRREEKVFPGTVTRWNIFESNWLLVFPTNSERSKVTLVSPRLSTSTNTSSDEPTTSHPPPWQQVIHKMWRHLHSHYTIKTNSACRTSIHLFRTETYTFSQLKQITSAILHFEPVICVLTNHDRHRHEQPSPFYSLFPFLHPRPPKENYRDNPLLGARLPNPLSRTESLALIASGEPNLKLGSAAYLIDLINPPSYDGREYCWVLQDIMSSGMIKHTQLPGCEGSEDAIRWVELTVAFIQGALACRIQDLKRMRPDHEGLRAFMSGVRSRSDGRECRRGSG